MTDKQFRALLNLWMCSDPWPAAEEDAAIFDDMLSAESMRRGYDNVVTAYHDFAPT